MSKPKISVCIPTKDRAAFLSEALQSVIAQTYSDVEIIVSDNASRDNTCDVVKGFKDTRIKYNRNKKDIGMSANWNKCLELASGEYVNIFHDDDIMLADNLRLKLECFEKNPGVGIVHSNITRIDETGKIIGKHWAKKPSQGYVRKGYEHMIELLTEKNNICAPSALIKKVCFDKAGLFDTRFGYASDWEMWMRIMIAFDVAYIGEPLVLYRCHPDMLTEDYLRTEGLAEIYKAKKSFLEKCGKHIPNAPEFGDMINNEYRTKAFDLAKRYWGRKEYLEALKSFVFGCGVR